MRFSGFRLPLLAALAAATVGLFVWATDRTYGDTVFVLPPSTTISSPYVIPSTYVLPSSYVLPRYVESSYTVAPAVGLYSTGLIETTYRRGLFGRRWVVERPVVASYPTAYVPTTYVSGYLPTTYVSSYLPTTYVSSYLPTTYVSSYLPTTYVAPSYYSTAYRVRRYRPTTYTYYPTVYETAYTTPADICCDTVAVDTSVRSAPPSSGAVSALSRPPREVESSSADDNAFDSVVPLPAETAKERSTARGNAATNAQTKDNTNRADSPPKPPAAGAVDDAGTAGAQKNAPAKTGGAPAAKKAAPPAAPADDSNPNDLAPAPGDDGVLRRDSLRPTYSRMRSADRRNILFGTVETEDGRPQTEVPVTVVNRTSTSNRHTGVTDAFGTFAIRVPDGQWTVRVTMPSGTMQTVRNITVTGGRIMDNLELREVQNLIISF